MELFKRNIFLLWAYPPYLYKKVFSKKILEKIFKDNIIVDRYRLL